MSMLFVDGMRCTLGAHVHLWQIFGMHCTEMGKSATWMLGKRKERAHTTHYGTVWQTVYSNKSLCECFIFYGITQLNYRFELILCNWYKSSHTSLLQNGEHSPISSTRNCFASSISDWVPSSQKWVKKEKIKRYVHLENANLNILHSSWPWSQAFRIPMAMLFEI